MARNRIIKPEFWADAKVGRLSFGARLLYIAMWNFSDDYGIISASPRRLLGEAFENDESVNIENVNEWIKEIEQQGQIKRFSANDKEWFEIIHFKDHQKVSHKSTRVNPQPSGDSPETLRQYSGSNVNVNGNENENGRTEQRNNDQHPKGALDPEAELFSKAIAITKENLSLTQERRQVLRDIRGNVNAGSDKFLRAVKNMMKSNWPNKTVTYFTDKKFDAINRIDHFANSPPRGNGFDSPPVPAPLKQVKTEIVNKVKYDTPAQHGK